MHHFLVKDIMHIYLYIFRHKYFKFLQIHNVYLPKSIKKFSVVRSPTMSKLSKEQFETRIFKVCILIDITTSIDFLLLKKILEKGAAKFSYMRCTFLISTYG
jgi:hypothetical protein